MMARTVTTVTTLAMITGVKNCAVSEIIYVYLFTNEIKYIF